jgi:hypothetical protein
MTNTVNGEPRSKVLPTDPFDIALSNVTGHPNGAHTQPSVVQSVDAYGNVSSFMVQTVKWDEGISVFITQVNAQGSQRFVLPPKVTAVMQRQHDAVSTMVRRRHGKRLAEEARAAGIVRTFTPEQRKKALATRKAKAAARKARREARAK